MDRAAAVKACNDLLGSPADVAAYVRSKDPVGQIAALLPSDYQGSEWTGLESQDLGTATRLFGCWLPMDTSTYTTMLFDFQEPNVQDPNCDTMWWANELTVCGVGFELYVKFDKADTAPDQSVPDVPKATQAALTSWLDAVASDVHF